MHELAVTQSVLDIALEHAEEAGAERIVRITLVIGDLSGIVDDSVQFYFDFLSRDTVAEGAQLAFERRPARFRCPACGEEYEPGELPRKPQFQVWACPNCGELYPEVVGGKEFMVESIEVE